MTAWNEVTRGLIASLADAGSNLAIWAEVTIDGNADTIDEVERELRLALSVVEKIKGPPPCFAILYGSPLDGFKAHGPFPSVDAANVWAEEMGEGGEWPIEIHPISPDSCHGLYPWDKGVPTTGTVLDYFERLFPGVSPGDAELVQALRSMPVESTCGADCRVTLDAAVQLVRSIAQAHGDGTKMAESVATDAAEVCGVFICG
jgi:hypothetical protein